MFACHRSAGCIQSAAGALIRHERGVRLCQLQHAVRMQCRSATGRIVALPWFSSPSRYWNSRNRYQATMLGALSDCQCNTRSTLASLRSRAASCLQRIHGYMLYAFDGVCMHAPVDRRVSPRNRSPHDAHHTCTIHPICSRCDDDHGRALALLARRLLCSLNLGPLGEVGGELGVVLHAVESGVQLRGQCAACMRVMRTTISMTSTTGGEHEQQMGSGSKWPCMRIPDLHIRARSREHIGHNTAAEDSSAARRYQCAHLFTAVVNKA